MDTLRRKPCPFCGSTNIDRLRSGVIYWLVCRECGGSGPSAESKAGALEEWNKRKEETDASV